MSIVGLSIETKDFKFNVFKKENGRFELESGGIHIEFPAEAVKLSVLPTEKDPHDPYAAIMSVRWGCGHKVHFTAYMPVISAQKLNAHFPEIELELE